jgi:tetratricopeptide (TPR) repeat protein
VSATPDLERDIAAADARLAERPGDDAAHEARARAYLALGRLDEAQRDAADAVRLDPDEIRYRELLAEVLAARGAHRDAAAEFARLARNDPRQVAWTLAEANERLEDADPERGIEAARRALRLDPERGDAHLALARGLTRLGDAPAALPAARRALELLPGDPAAAEALADALWLGGDAGQAFELYRRLALRLGGVAGAPPMRKVRALYRDRAGWAGRILAAAPGLFAVAFRRGWLHPR